MQNATHNKMSQTFWPSLEKCPEMPMLPAAFYLNRPPVSANWTGKLYQHRFSQIFCQQPLWL